MSKNQNCDAGQKALEHLNNIWMFVVVIFWAVVAAGVLYAVCTTFDSYVDSKVRERTMYLDSKIENTTEYLGGRLEKQKDKIDKLKNRLEPIENLLSMTVKDEDKIEDKIEDEHSWIIISR